MAMMPSQLYICRGEADDDRVEQLYDRLLAAGLNPWMKSMDILTGDDPDTTVREAIAQSDQFLVIYAAHDFPAPQELDAIAEGRPSMAWKDYYGRDYATLVSLDGSELSIEDLLPSTQEMLGSSSEEHWSEEEGWDPLLAKLTGYDPSMLPEPKVPDDLVRACADRDCILFAGEGVSTLAGFPPKSAMILRLLDWLMEEENLGLDASMLRTWRREVKMGDVDLVANNLYEALYHPFETDKVQIPEEQRLEPLYAYLRDVYAQPGLSPATPDVLTQVDFAAAMTTNLDDSLELGYAMAAETPSVYVPRDSEQLRKDFSKGQLFILKLYGSLHRPETLCLAEAQYRDAVRDNEPFLQFMQTVLLSRNVLFIGAPLEAISNLLEAVQLRPRTDAPTHYALAPVSGSAWQTQADRLLRRYGVQVLPYASHQECGCVSFLRELAEHAQERRRSSVKTKEGPARLQIVRLENIGPFEVLELELDPHWSILLGDNGVGKSTIIKAIAVGICGQSAQPYAHRLIRSGQTSGAVILQTTEGTKYVTEIMSTDDGARVHSRTVRPLDAEGWLALGFPPLRTFGWERPQGPDPQEPVRRPTAGDLLPLIVEEPDPRMEGLKQWLLNLDYWNSKQEVTTTGDPRKYERLLDEFFRIVDQLTTEVTIKRGDVNPQTGEITIISDDGPIPVELLSQGTESLIGWTGIMLRRLYEVYGDDQDFSNQYALVLMDELDAHMHPEWQRMLVHNLSELFPKVQFIATTHSPLVVGGMPVNQVVRLARDELGRVVRLDVDPDMTMGRADQVLTGSLFGLRTTLDSRTLEIMQGEYATLLGKRNRTEPEVERLRELQRELEFRIPVPQELPTERRAQELLHILLEEQAGDLYPEVQERLLTKARQLLEAVQTQGGQQA